MPLGNRRSLSLFLTATCVALAGTAFGQAQDEQAKKANAAFFQDKVFPILKAHCFKCHVHEKKGGLQMLSREALLKGGETGPALVPGKPEDSLLISSINYGEYEMPPSGKLPQDKIDILTRWVELAAPWSPDVKIEPQVTEGHGPPQINEKTKNHWAFKRVQRPAVPKIENVKWVRNPIDAFILGPLEKNGFAPAHPADRIALLRRAFYDLTGLPPSPEEVDAFLTDDSPRAFEKVVDRLLESPHYGEKWARHWLDVVRYAETNSYERDGAKPFVWRYRDYVIRSLNEDKPYDQFIREQLAGDEIANPTPESIIATGFYRLGIWQDEPVSAVKALYDDLDDIVSTTAQGFLGLTINCARCHDHKLDPIPQDDYYRMIAFFRNVRRFGVRGNNTIMAASVRSIGAEEQIKAHRQKLQGIENELKALEKLVWDDLTGIEKDEFQTEEARIEIVQKRVGKQLTDDQFRRYVALTSQRDELRKFKTPGAIQVLCVKEHGPKAP
ncbi:MAG: DUF1549 domain-containing protein, partial [Planctomycetes bacterium]|nr:DUF1549 domain-containing protein [Planctomycetota bacterium]